MPRIYYDLTSAQKSIWLTEQFASNTSLNNVGGYVFIDEMVDFIALEKALNLYVKKNDALNLRIVLENGEPKQYLADFEFLKIDIIHINTIDELEEFNKNFTNKNFEFMNSPLYRLTMFKLPDGRGGFNATIHHFVSDAWSMGLLISEVMDVYSKLIKKEEIDNKSFPSYIEYISSEQEYINNRKFQKSHDFWSDVFDYEPDLSYIVPDKKNETDTTAIRKIFKLDSDLYRQIDSFCKENRCSIYTFFMSIFSIYTAKINNLHSSIIGTPVLNRSNFKEKHTAGMFISTVPFKIETPAENTFTEFLKRTSSMQISIFRHQKYPYDILLKEVKAKHSLGENLYDLVLSYQNARDDSRSSDVNYSSKWVFSGHIVDTLEIHFYDMDDTGELELLYDYQTAKLTEQEVCNINNRIMEMTKLVLSKPDILLKDIPVVTKEEQNYLVTDFNYTPYNYDKNKSLVSIFEEHVNNNPDKTAVIFENSKLTYSELNEKANKLAHLLIKQGIKRNTVVGIMFPRCLDILVAIWGVLKAGSGYLLIDPSLPTERIAYMIDNSKTPLLITNASMKIAFKNKIILDENLLKKFSAENPRVETQMEDTFCVIYTSGSTGTPKGSELKRLGIVNMLHSYKKFLHSDICDVFLSTSTVAFDMFIVENFISILSGKTVVLANDEEQKVPIFMSKLIKEHNVDFILSTPSKIELLLSNENTCSCLKNIKILQLGGEVFKQTLYNRLRQNTNAYIFNGYGPSECTACSSSKEITDGADITIGLPVLNTKIYILNTDMNLLPIGYIGEICILGDVVGKGYLNRPDLTQTSFVLDPISGNTMYKTGDMAKYLPNGELVYYGRRDLQVKLHGLRIELGEITSKIVQVPGIKDAVCVIKKVNDIDAICCYAISKNTEITSDIVKNLLRKEIPPYMVPAHVIFMDSFPITHNGKIDLKKLPDIDIKVSEYVTPETETELILQQIWEDILKTKKISVNTNFFDLGGDSLCSIRLVSEVYSKFNTKISIKNIFEHSTIRSLAKHIDKLSHKNILSGIKKTPIRSYYPLSSAQERIYYTSQLDPNSIMYNTPGGLVFDKVPDVKKLEKCFNTLINTYDALRTYFVLEDKNIVQKVLDVYSFKLTVKYVGSKTKSQLFEEFISPFDLKKAPLLRTALYIFPDDTAILLIDLHHIICDGASISNFVDALCKLYNGEKITTPKFDYIDYAVWEQEQINSSTYKNSENYWLKQFKEDSPVLNMPTNYPRPTMQSFDGAKVYGRISNIAAISSLCKTLNTTPYMLLLSVYYILLYKYTGQNDIVVGSPIVGRDNSDVTDMIGMFVNTLPLRTHIKPEDSFKTFLNYVTHNCFNAFENQTYPFNELLKKLNIARDTSHNPLFDTMFIYQNNGNPKINLNGLSSTYYIPDNHTSKFDFSLEIRPENDSMHVSLEYCNKLFKKSFMEDFLNHYLNILQEVLANSDVSIKDIQMLSDKEKTLALESYNNTYNEYDKDITIYQLIEKQAQLTPNNIAVKFKEKEITYKELDELSNSLAHYLSARGIGRGSNVGIMLSRSLEVLVSILGTLKTGACYIPIDPTFPQNRVEYMLENSNCSAVLTFKDLMSNINFSNMIDVNLDNLDIYSESKESLNTISKPTDPSYIIYTSGSTGKPKGVMLNHMALTNLTNYLNRHVCFFNEPANNIAIVSMTTISFDIFIFETLICLQKGLKVIMATEEEQTSPNLLNTLIENENIKAIQLTPSRMQFFIDHQDLIPNLGNIDFVVLAGEALPNTLLTSLLELGIKKVYNGYGPSETTVFSTFTDVTEYTDVTIGKPIDNTKIYLLDNNLNLVPLGTPGEIYIAGDSLAIEYINNPEITNSSFIPNPFEPHTLMYRTGDIAKYLPNGELYYIGRSDHQVKIRGLRIELEEIQKWILQFPNISKVILMTQKLKTRTFLVAYIVPTDRISVSKLRTFLKTNLPQYMVPSYFVILDDFPYLPNGKVDKKSLPIPQDMKIGNSINYVAPITKLEIQLAGLFEKVLSVSPIGLNDNFFHLGGDSLSAMTLQVELLKITDTITYSDIFMYPTVKDLAIKIKSNKKSHYEMEDAKELSNLNTIISNNNILPKNLEYKSVGNILISGTTGFLGAHILSNYLDTEKGTAYCIIRPEPGISIKDKFINKLHFYFGNKYDTLIENRIKIINSDISKINLGLSLDKVNELLSHVDCIINAAAKVTHYGDYNSYKEINVKGTHHLLSLAGKYNKRFYHISTLSISGNSLVDQSFIEQNFTDNFDFKENHFYINQNLDNVYVRSKFEAEKLILKAINNGTDAYILRIGNLMGRYADGKFQKNVEENAYVNRLISFSKIRCIPEYIRNGYLEFTPVDKCAEGILDIIKYPNKQNRIFHLLNHKTINVEEFLKIFNKYYGNISIVASDEFLDKIDTFMKSEISKPYVNGILSDFNDKHELVYESKINLNSEFTINYLSKIGFSWPEVKENYIKLFFDYLTSLGYFNK